MRFQFAHINYMDLLHGFKIDSLLNEQETFPLQTFKSLTQEVVNHIEPTIQGGCDSFLIFRHISV